MIYPVAYGKALLPVFSDMLQPFMPFHIDLRKQYASGLLPLPQRASESTTCGDFC